MAGWLSFWRFYKLKTKMRRGSFPLDNHSFWMKEMEKAHKKSIIN